MDLRARVVGLIGRLEGLIEAGIDLNKMLDSPCLSAIDACPIVGGAMDMSEHERYGYPCSLELHISM